ncbi:MAG: sugar ABC transporter ATP-binding protein [Eubacterium sp.]|jgi:ribose transport system ATP-binding protein|nr:sugar ABC transporter ATP-binding protein [Eubacterium sp.]
MSQYYLEMIDVFKEFPGVKALKGVNLKVKKGEVHALIGENGAGKSTLMKILSGLYHSDGGKIRINGEDMTFQNPQDAINAGVATIYQELSLVPHLTAVQNVLLGHEIAKYKFIDGKREKEVAGKLLDYVSRGSLPSYSEPVMHFSVAQQQMVDIAKALSYNANIIIMDEPTDSLTDNEIEVLFEIIRKLKADGMTIIYISHRLEELMEICDRVTVMRDGEYIADADTKDIDKAWLIRNMIGREMTNSYPERKHYVSEEIVLDVKKLSSSAFTDVSFELKRGEILGFAGLVGSGRTEVMRVLFGVDKAESGEVILEGNPVNIHHPSSAVENGIGFATEDRKTEGLFLNLDIKTNISAAALPKVSKKGFISSGAETAAADKYISELRIVTPGNYQICKNLSGGNQQKVVLAKWLASDSKILILDEPTRGIDVGAKYEIYTLMDNLAQAGVSIIMVSSELPEVIGMSDRVVVMHEGRVTGILEREDFSEETIMTYASGHVN